MDLNQYIFVLSLFFHNPQTGTISQGSYTRNELEIWETISCCCFIDQCFQTRNNEAIINEAVNLHSLH